LSRRVLNFAHWKVGHIKVLAIRRVPVIWRFLKESIEAQLLAMKHLSVVRTRVIAYSKRLYLTFAIIHLLETFKQFSLQYFFLYTLNPFFTLN
jgi:hypothetical protein